MGLLIWENEAGHECGWELKGGGGWWGDVEDLREEVEDLRQVAWKEGPYIMSAIVWLLLLVL